MILLKRQVQDTDFSGEYFSDFNRIMLIAAQKG